MSRFRIPYREFLLRIVDLELIAPQGDMSKLPGQFTALLIQPTSSPKRFRQSD